jgi:hypothetical protein
MARGGGQGSTRILDGVLFARREEEERHTPRVAARGGPRRRRARSSWGIDDVADNVDICI